MSMGAPEEVIVGDTETTGLHPDGTPPDRLCSASFIRLRRLGGIWREVDVRTHLVDPGREIPEGAARVNGFTWTPGGARFIAGRRNLACEARFSPIAGPLRDWLGDTPLVFHNAVFDCDFLDAEFQAADVPLLDQPILCTKKAFSDIMGLGRPDVYVPGTNLDALCDRLGIDRSSRLGPDGRELHGAEVDARLAARAFMKLEQDNLMLAEPARDLPHRKSLMRNFMNPF